MSDINQDGWQEFLVIILGSVYTTDTNGDKLLKCGIRHREWVVQVLSLGCIRGSRSDKRGRVHLRGSCLVFGCAHSNSGLGICWLQLSNGRISRGFFRFISFKIHSIIKCGVRRDRKGVRRCYILGEGQGRLGPWMFFFHQCYGNTTRCFVPAQKDVPFVIQTADSAVP